jgi:hypothetical protein
MYNVELAMRVRYIAYQGIGRMYGVGEPNSLLDVNDTPNAPVGSVVAATEL